MSSIVLPKRFYSQPKGAAQVDWAHPICKYIDLVWAFGPGEQSKIRSAWNPELTSTAAWQAGRGLYGGYGDNSSSAQRIFNSTVAGAAGTGTFTESTLFAVCTAHVTNTGQTTLISTQIQSAKHESLYFRGTADQMCFSVRDSIGFEVRAPAGAFNRYADTPQVVVGVFENAQIKIYINGALQATATGPSAINSRVALSPQIGGGQNGGSATGMEWGGILGMYGYSTKAMPADVVKAFSTNVWQIYKASE